MASLVKYFLRFGFVSVSGRLCAKDFYTFVTISGCVGPRSRAIAEFHRVRSGYFLATKENELVRRGQASSLGLG